MRTYNLSGRHLKKTFILAAFLMSLTGLKAQSRNDSTELQHISAALASKDSLLFNAVFNTCNFKEIESILDKRFVFYQDQGTTAATTSQPYKDFVESIQKNFCDNKSTKMKRELVKGSLQVFLPSENTAVQTGVQRFYMVKEGMDIMVEESKFSREWQKAGSDWKLSRELDYLVNTKFNSAHADSLYNIIAQMDSTLFSAYNAHNTTALMNYFTKDLEFYHDKTGLTTYGQNMEAFKNNFERNKDIRRELVKESLEVYPVKDYGAIEIGSHRFCHTENGKMICGVFKFAMVWQNKNGEWKISRIISYDH